MLFIILVFSLDWINTRFTDSQTEALDISQILSEVQMMSPNLKGAMSYEKNFDGNYVLACIELYM